MNEERSNLQVSWTGSQLVAWRIDDTSAHVRNTNSLLMSRVLADLGVFPEKVAQFTAHVPDGPVTVDGLLIRAFGLGTGRKARSRGYLAPSAQWCADLVEFVNHMVAARRVGPRLVETAPDEWHATWRPLWDDEMLAALEAFVTSMPAAVRALSPVPAAGGAGTHGAARFDAVESATYDDSTDFTRTFLEHITDIVTRSALYAVKWTPAPLRGLRGDDAAAMRRVVEALSTGETIVDRLSSPMLTSLAGLAVAFDRLASRMAGEPVIAARLRLGLPDGADQPWPLSLELYDADDPSRWCTAADVIEATPLAADLSRGERHAALLNEALRSAVEAIVDSLPNTGTAWSKGRIGTLELDDVATSALLDAVPALEGRGVALTAPSQILPAAPALRGQARPAPAAGNGRFSRDALVDWTMTVDDVAVDEVALIRAAELGSSLLNVDGRWVRIDVNRARKAVKALREQRSKHSVVTPSELMALAGDPDLSFGMADGSSNDHTDGAEGDVVQIGDESAMSAQWVRQLLNGLPDEQLAEGVEPPSFAAPLRPYQRRGLGWMQFLARLGLGGCLADDMGLGKTPTTLAHLAGRPGPHLVICPLSVVRNWQNETFRFAPLMRVHIHHGADRLHNQAFLNAVTETDIVISTYGLVARDIATLATVEWSTVVLDEAQTVKNAHTNAAKAVRRLRAEQKVALTGTPVENRLVELWSILDVVNPGLLGSEKRFQTRWATPIERDRNEEAALALRRVTSPFVLRRTKADKALVPDLPDKVEQLAWATLTKEQATMYEAVVNRLLEDAEAETGMKRRGLVLASLTRLKQICNHPAHALGDGSRLAGRSGKLARFDELVDDLLDAGERALVFTQFREMGELLARHLHERLGLTCPFLHGGVSKSRRDRMVDEFQAGAGAPLLLVSLKAGGTGLNLTAASRVVHYDRWWNPAVEDQATDRAWRLGQTRAVFVSKLVCQGTVEERINQVIDEKRALAGAVIGTGEGEGWLSEMSTDQLRDLVRLDPSAVERRS